MIYALVAPFALAYMIYKLKDRVEETDYKFKFGTLTDRLSTRYFSQLFSHVVVLFKLLFTIFVLVLLRDFPAI